MEEQQLGDDKHHSHTCIAALLASTHANMNTVSSVCAVATISNE